MSSVSICGNCGISYENTNRNINRAKRRGWNLYCSQECSNLGQSLAPEEKKKRNDDYLRHYRSANAERIRMRRAAYHKKNYCSDAASAKLKGDDEFRLRRSKIGRRYYAKRKYGDHADSFMILREIKDECASQQEISKMKYEAGRIGKSAKRKNEYGRTISEKLENSPLGNPGRP